MQSKVNSLSPAALGAMVNGDIENFIVASTPGGIEAQEARGQKDMTARFDRLPKKGPGNNSDLHREFESLGFVFGEDIDDLFIRATPPAGWELRPTELSMWSDILDDKGRKRGAVFYKAAFYDRRAHAFLMIRYYVTKEYDESGEKARIILEDNGTGINLRESGWLGSSEWGAQDEISAEYQRFLDSKFPDAKNPLAYWE